jgi:hypothetical protein
MACRSRVLVGMVALSLCVSTGDAQTRSTPARRGETYQAVAIDARGNLVITTSDRRTVVVPKEAEQTSFEAPLLSSNRTAVGTTAKFPNCCTSYDIPMKLVVYANGRTHRFTGIGLPIFQWHFADGGTRVAFGQEPVHFGCSIHYELRDIESERLIESADVPEPCGLNPNPTVEKVPDWVSDLTSETGR